jgi:hypothetical protein
MKGKVEVELRDKNGKLKKVVGANAICSHMNNGAYVEMMANYTAPDTFREDLVIKPQFSKLLSSYNPFTTLYLSDNTEYMGSDTLDVPGNILATCPYAGTTENVENHVGAWDSAYSYRNYNSITRTYRFGLETFQGVVGSIGWMNDSRMFPFLNICGKRNILYYQYIGNNRLLVVYLASDPVQTENNSAFYIMGSAGGTREVSGKYWKQMVAFSIIDMNTFEITHVANDEVYWYRNTTSSPGNYPLPCVYFCDGANIYFYDSFFRRMVINLETGYKESNDPHFEGKKLMGANESASEYSGKACYREWQLYLGGKVRVYPVWYAATESAIPSAGTTSHRQYPVYINNDTLYVGSSNVSVTHYPSISCNIISAIRLEDNYQGCGLTDCWVADKMMYEGTLEQRQFYLGTEKWTSWFCAGTEYIYTYDAIATAGAKTYTVKKIPIADFLQQLEECTIGNPVYIDVSSYEEEARFTHNGDNSSTAIALGDYICDEGKYVVNGTGGKMQNNSDSSTTNAGGICVSTKEKTRCSSIYILNEPLNKTLDDTLTLKYTISFDASELLP